MDTEGKEERRKFERFPFLDDILIGGTSTCTSMDISEGGLYISTIQSYEENDEIDVTIKFQAVKVTVKAQVRYCQPGIGMGVMFVDLTTEQRSKIAEIIEGIKRESVPPEIEKKSILLVEDNNRSRQVIKSALAKEGFIAIEASDGIGAMKILGEQTPDLIILDLYMSGIDGFKMLSFLRADPKWKELPVIVCSAHDTQEIKEKVLNAGVQEFLPKKGTTPGRLVEAVKRVLQQRSNAH